MKILTEITTILVDSIKTGNEKIIIFIATTIPATIFIIRFIKGIIIDCISEIKTKRR